MLMTNLWNCMSKQASLYIMSHKFVDLESVRKPPRKICIHSEILTEKYKRNIQFYQESYVKIISLTFISDSLYQGVTKDLNKTFYHQNIYLYLEVLNLMVINMQNKKIIENYFHNVHKMQILKPNFVFTKSIFLECGTKKPYYQVSA